jgi:hypothetical protein
MSKPIFIIRFPHAAINNEDKFLELYKQISEQLVGYHVLSLLDSSIQRVEFECYNAPHTDIEFEELKRIVVDMLTNIATQISYD